MTTSRQPHGGCGGERGRLEHSSRAKSAETAAGERNCSGALNTLRGVSSGLRVVVLTYGTSGVHGPLLESLREEGVDPARILVVHNPSRPGESPPGIAAGVETIVAPHNLGYAAGMNLGLRRVLAAPEDSEFVLVLTHDARLRRGALDLMLAAARSQPRFGALGPVLLYVGTETPFSFGGVRLPNGRLEHRRVRPAGDAEIAACEWIDGGTMLVRTAALRSAGEFDERFWGYVEEAELCLRIERAGYAVGVVLAAAADQDPGGPKRPGPWAYLLTRNGLAYAQRSLGGRAVARQLAGAAWRVVFETARAASRALRLRPGSPFEPWAVAVGVARGAVDFLRGRWGPPPADLPGAGDVGNLGG
jgi:N-acetylglucosaminyl-diphospho-decaprenol L-rhamnosyltransferase